MTLDRAHLQLLAALREMGRLGDAARSLHLSPSAASHRLAEAERRAGTQLTESRGRTLSLTPAGEVLAASAIEIEEQVSRALLTARWVGSGEPRRVRVAIGFYDTVGWLLDTFEPIDGQPRIELLRFNDDRLLEAVRTRAADIAIAPWPAPPSGLRNTLLAPDVLVAAVPANSEFADDDPVTPEEMYGATFLTSDYRPTRGFEFHEFFLAADTVPVTVVRVQSLEVMLRLVGNGSGVTIQPSLVLTWNRPHHEVQLVALSGKQIPVRWMATFRNDADETVVAAAERIRAAFVAASDRGEGAVTTLVGSDRPHPASAQ